MLRFDTVTPSAGGGYVHGETGGAAAASGAAAVLGDGAATRVPVAASLHALADYASLKRISDALDEAVAEIKTPHAKRVIRYIR